MANKNRNVPSGSDIVLSARNAEQKNALKTIHQHDISFIYGPAGTGKAQPLTSLVMTPDGPKLMRDISIGSQVCAPDGSISNVIGVYPQGVVDVYRIVFSDGDSVLASADHLWEVSSVYGWTKIVDTSYIKENCISPSGRRLLSIRTPDPLCFHYSDVPIDPYLLGAFLGDGSFVSQTPQLCATEDQILQEASTNIEAGYHLRHNQNYDHLLCKRQRGGNSFYIDALRELGLDGLRSYEKFIPKQYLYNSVEVRLALLQGIMDTDGYVDKKTGLPEVSTSSNRLAKDIKLLIESIGGICVVRPQKTSYTYNGNRKRGRISYRCFIRFNDTKSLFRLDRKKETALNRSKYLTKRIIQSVHDAGRDLCQCIKIDHPESLYLTNHCVITHNTHLAVAYGLKDFLDGKYERLIFTRPCVEAYGERLGFLPGDFNAKISPYMMPIFDILSRYLSRRILNTFIDEGSIVTLPLAYQRGITFSNAYVVGDEFQNTVPEQVRMMLTRLGEDSKIVITGDLMQADASRNGLYDALRRLRRIEGIGFAELSHESVVRHPLVVRVDKHYEMGLGEIECLGTECRHGEEAAEAVDEEVKGFEAEK